MAGRTYDDLSLHHKLFINIGQAMVGKDGGRVPGTGSLEQIINDFRRVRDLGYDGFIVRYIGEDASEQQDQIARFAAEIVPKI